MLRRFTFLVLLGGAVMLAAAESAQARTYVGIGVGVGRPYYGYGYGRYGYGYPGYYGYNPYYYPRPVGVAVYQPVYVQPTVAYSVAPAYTAAPAAASANSATVQVLVPDGNAEVWMEGRKMPSNGSTTRVYASPSLEPGKSYTYSVTAAWFRNGKIVKEERSVPVTAGATQVVDFRKGGGVEGLPMPAPATVK